MRRSVATMAECLPLFESQKTLLALKECLLAHYASDNLPNMSHESKQLSEQLRDAILNAEVSRYRIAKETGLTQAGLSRFVNGVAGLSLDSIDKVGECLGLEVKIRQQKRPKRKRK